MSKAQELLEARFLLNMGRITGMVQLLESNEALKPQSLFGPREGVRADILRSIVVFLHATFEVALRSRLPKSNQSLSFYSRSDLDKALRLSNIDATPFRALYPSLTDMAKRRKRIVHDADWSNDSGPAWGIADDWRLIMWLLVVPAFYYQLRISCNLGSTGDQATYQALRAAMAGHVTFGNQLVAFPNVPRERRLQALQESLKTLKTVLGTLKMNSDAIIITKGLPLC